jgi:hypothetical protein
VISSRMLSGGRSVREQAIRNWFSGERGKAGPFVLPRPMKIDEGSALPQPPQALSSREWSPDARGPLVSRLGLAVAVVLPVPLRGDFAAGLVF